MKKNIVLLILVLTLGACFTNVYAAPDEAIWIAEAQYEAYINQLPVYDKHGHYSIIVESLDDLENIADVVIEATVLPGRQNKIISEFGIIGYHRTELAITKVHSGDLAEGDVIVVREPFAVMDYYRDIYDFSLDKEPMLITRDGYRPAKAGETYLFFLTKSSNIEYWGEEQYSFLICDTTRYPVPAQTAAVPSALAAPAAKVGAMSNEALGLAPEEEYYSATYRSIYTEILEKYYK